VSRTQRALHSVNKKTIFKIPSGEAEWKVRKKLMATKLLITYAP